MEKLNIEAALNAGWQSFKTRPWYLLGLALAVFFLFIFSIGEATVTALAYLLLGGYLALLIRHYRGEHVVFDDLFITDTRWINFAFLGLIKSLLIFLGLLFFIVPGIYLAVRWSFAELYVIEEGKRPVEALRASYALTQGYWWKLFAYALLVLLMMIVGTLALVVGAVVVSVVVGIAHIKLFDDLRGIQWRANNPQ